MPFAAQIRCQKAIKKPIVVDNEKVHGVRALEVRVISAVAVPAESAGKRPKQRWASSGHRGDSFR
jgi:hypothetical protein